MYNRTDERIKFWGQKFTVQGHSGITYWNHHCTGGCIQYSTSRVELDFLITFILILGGGDGGHGVVVVVVVVHCVPKNDTDVTHYRLNPHEPISVIFGRDVAERVYY